MDPESEPLGSDHRQDIADIFNHYVRTGFAAFPQEEVGGDFVDRLLAMCQGYPALAIRADERTVGSALLRPYHPAASFRHTAEITFFLAPEYTGRGIGKQVLARLTESARAMGIENLIATVASLNTQSVRFHERAGFECCGRLRAVGRKLRENFDLVLFQKRLGAAPSQNGIGGIA